MLEIERKFLLARMPDIPLEAERWQIDQGYLAPPQVADALPGAEPGASLSVVGRIRRIVFQDGTIICTHTIKTGSGMVRQQVERNISIEQFEQLWPRTAGRRIRKRRHRVHDAHALWEIDEFQDMDLVIAEIELPTPDAEVRCPTWLEHHVVREVTDDPQYTNAAIALRMGQAERR